ncbi:cytochrome P450 72A397-like isoform X2 [Rhodamnia argentea]|uniref:Cytochrome P450 72A397-like isoform X2 n=1 Tax=Rhodamnia argentea TaxID=178133 RepID=A0ABM3H3K8_9MYRT|nr:cytochrome P450 72A397-like isoform X2 [Rhodamnia argentea]
MEVSTQSIALVAVLAVLVTWAWRVVNWVWLRPKRLERLLRQQGLSGEPYAFLFGDLNENERMLTEATSKPIAISDDIKPRLLPFLHRSFQIHGKDSFMWMGQTPRVNITNPEQLKEIFSKIYDYIKPASTPLIKLLVDGLATHEGEKWARHRKIINPAFHMEKLKLMLPAFYSSCTEMIDGWDELVSDERSCEVDVWIDLQNLTRDVISRTAFGSSFEEGKRIFELQREQTMFTSKALRSLYIPDWRFVPTKMNRRMKSIDKEVQALLTDIVRRREKAIRAGEAAGTDLLGLLLESNMKDNIGMSLRDVIEECKLFYFAGQETTSVLLVWTMVLLSVHPDWQARAREEILQTFGRRKPDFDGLSHLKIVTMILNEVLRLYPPATLLERKVQKEIKLGKLTIPPGVRLSMPILFIHHDKELWGEDAEEFKPERFAEGVSKATKNQVSFFPFGWGPRICIGMNFSMIEAKMALAMILQQFTFELSPSYAHAPWEFITLQPQYGAQVILHKAN